MAFNSYSTNFGSISDAEVDTDSDSSDLVDNNAEAEDEDEESDEDDPKYDLRFGEFFKSLEQHVKAARHRQLRVRPTQSKAEHNRYWRSYFTQVRQDAAAQLLPRSTIYSHTFGLTAPEGQPILQTGPLFEPPCNKLGIVLADRADVEPTGCPCCLGSTGHPDIFMTAPDALLSSVLSRPESSAQAAARQGVTFDQLLKEISDALYGRDDDTPPEFYDRDEARPVLHHLTFMLDDKGLMDGCIYLYIDDVATGAAGIDSKFGRS